MWLAIVISVCVLLIRAVGIGLRAQLGSLGHFLVTKLTQISVRTGLRQTTTSSVMLLVALLAIDFFLLSACIRTSRFHNLYFVFLDAC